MTIMSQACAERCNIMRLVDRRWQALPKVLAPENYRPSSFGMAFIQTCSFNIHYAFPPT